MRLAVCDSQNATISSISLKIGSLARWDLPAAIQHIPMPSAGDCSYLLQLVAQCHFKRQTLQGPINIKKKKAYVFGDVSGHVFEPVKIAYFNIVLCVFIPPGNLLHPLSVNVYSLLLFLCCDKHAFASDIQRCTFCLLGVVSVHEKYCSVVLS